MPLTNGSGSVFGGSDPAIFVKKVFLLISFCSSIYSIFSKKSQNSRYQGFPYFFA
jgi:hypothetical protein